MMPKIFALATLVAVAFIGSFQAAQAEQKIFENPRYKNLALDWCKSWANECGKPAADAWCVKQGYDSSAKFSKYEDIGEPTRVISSNQICDEAGCDGFTKVTCQKADAYDDEDQPVKYDNPMVGKRRLDWCLDWATNCGKPAADYYCKKQGHSTAIGFKIDENIFKTRLLKTGQKCTQPDCDGFKYIECE
jgi:hypothetical protein